MNNTPLHLHIGLQKTASTTLQETLFLRHPQIHYLGKAVKHKKIKKNCLDDITYRILKPILWDVKKPMDTKETLSLFQDTLLPTISKDQVFVGSWESLGCRPIKRQMETLNRCKAIFGGCRIMITLRNPLFLMPSLYLQNLHEDFLWQKHNWLDPQSYAEIEVWYKNRMSRFNNALLKYSECIKNTINELGRENVGVFLYEELQENPKAYYQSICEFIGIDSEIGVSLALGKHLYPRLSDPQLSYMRKIQSSLLGRALHSYSSIQRRRKALEARVGPLRKSRTN